MSIPILKENEFSLIGKVMTGICIFVLIVVALLNIWRGDVSHPGLFFIAIAGFLFFLVAKLSVITSNRRISFGTRFMSPAMANIYRAGYWLMFVGVLATFL